MRVYLGKTMRVSTYTHACLPTRISLSLENVRVYVFTCVHTDTITKADVHFPPHVVLPRSPLSLVEIEGD